MIENADFKGTDNYINATGWNISGAEFVKAIVNPQTGKIEFLFKKNLKTEKAIQTYLQDKPSTMGVRSILSLGLSFRQMIFDLRA